MNKLIIFLFMLFATFSLSAFSQESFPTEKIKQITEELVHVSTETNLKITSEQLNQLVESAKIRNEIFTKTLIDNPKQLVKYLIPNKISRGLPNSIQPYLEKVVNNIEGTLEINDILQRKDAKISQQETTQYLLRTNDKKVYYLHFLNGLPKNLKTGVRIRIREAYLIPARNNQLLILSNDELTITRQVAKNALPDAFGPQESLVFMLNFQDKPTDRPFTIDQIKDTIFNTVNKMFIEFSYGQTTVVGDVINWTTVPINSTDSCDTITDKMSESAESIAKAAGYDLSRYSRKIFIFPTTSTCGWAGLANRGGKPTNLWINGYTSSEVIGHEMGHNVGLPHSNSLECNTTGCKLVPYGDYADTMGIPYFYPNSHFNAAQKELLGWLGFQSSPPILTISNSGTYVIDAYETKNGKAKALKILKEIKSDGSRDYYYIEFRQGIGFDVNIGNCTDCNFTKGVLVHQANSVDIEQTVLLDMSPEDTDKSRMVALLPGKSFNDPKVPNGGVTITLNSISTESAVLNVTFGSQPPPICKHVAPTMTVSPSTTQWIYAGGYAQYGIFLKNNDSEKCTPSNYILTVNQMRDMVSSLSSNLLSVEPGKTKGVYLNVSTRPRIQRGIYSILTNAKNASDPTATASAVASLGVIRP
jgi:hypothetical protein